MNPYILQFGIYSIYTIFWGIVMFSYGKPRSEDFGMVGMMEIFTVLAHIIVTLILKWRNFFNYQHLIAVILCFLITFLLLGLLIKILN